jgi:hypothetical protein
MWMRNVVSRTALILSIVATLAFTACGNFFVSEDATDHITLSGTVLLLSTQGASGAESKQITATAFTVGGASSDVTSTGTWTTASAAVATVTANGTITAVGQGNTTVTIKSGGASSSIKVIVVASSIGAFNVTPASANLHLTSGPQTQQLSAIVTLGSGTLDVSDSAQWTTDASTVASVNNAGLVTAQNSGSIITSATANITATILGAGGNLTASSRITVDSL